MPPELCTKVLSRTDVGESHTHQAGILIPVSDGERLFPDPLGRQSVDLFQCVDQTGETWTFGFRHRVKSSESRITRTTRFIKRYLLRSGDRVTIRAPAAPGAPTPSSSSQVAEPASTARSPSPRIPAARSPRAPCGRSG